MAISQWTRTSIDLANQRNYLDLLFKVYPISVNLQRELPEHVITQIQRLYEEKAGEELLKLLLEQEVFPIKDSYVAYLKRDPGALNRNPQTCARLSGMLYEMGLTDIIARASAPKETNRQMGPLFKEWIKKGSLGCYITGNPGEFKNYVGNVVFIGSDKSMKDFASSELGYRRAKGLDFLAKFNSTFIMGEAKFLTDFGGHQNAQFEDAILTLKTRLTNPDIKAIKVAILDGVLYIAGKNKLHQELKKYAARYPILSALLLRDFLYSI